MMGLSRVLGFFAVTCSLRFLPSACTAEQLWLFAVWTLVYSACLWSKRPLWVSCF